MKTGERTVVTQIIGSDDGNKTYEVRRIWDETKRQGIVIALYPTIKVENIDRMDMSTLHLLNHTNDFGWGGVRILNLCAQVFDKKPVVSKLTENNDNLEYIKSVLAQKDISNYDIVIAWGSGIANHLTTAKKKVEVLQMLQKRKLSKVVKCMETDFMGDAQQGVHPLFLGLHHPKEEWRLVSFSIDDAMESLTELVEKTELKKVNKNDKGVDEDVLQNKE